MAQTKTATKKTTKKLTGKARAEQSKELFKNIREYHILGFRIGDGLRNMFDTLVASISKKKAYVHPIYTYTVHGGTSLVTYNFGIGITGEKLVKYSVDVVINKNKPEKAGLHLSVIPDAPGMGFKVSDFPFSEKGVKDLVKAVLKDAKAAK